MEVVLRASEWIYRVEGSLHMVLGYVGDSRRFQGKILRLETGDGSIESQPIEKENEFIRGVFGRQLGDYVDAGELVPVSAEFLKEVEAMAEDKRPEHRKKKCRIRMDQKIALVQTDFCRMFSEHERKTICVEIKPKCGVLSRSKLVSPSICDALGKFTTLPYYLKNYAGEDLSDGTPRYNPAELLSGDKSLLEKAIETLRIRRAHTLRVFVDGEVAVADDLESKIFSTMDEAYNSEFTLQVLKVATLAFVDGRESLHGILMSQNLDFVDNIGAERILKRLKALIGEENIEKAVWKAHFESYNEEDFEEVVTALSYPAPEDAKKRHCESEYQAACKYVDQIGSEVAASILARFLQSGTAKDCSVMISMCQDRPLTSEEVTRGNIGVLKDSNGSTWTYCLNVVDLEPKVISRIQKWADRDRSRLGQKFLLPKE